MLQSVVINFYGRAILSPVHLNFEMLNSQFITDFANEGILLQGNCFISTRNNYNGLVLFNNFTFGGQRFFNVHDSLIYISTSYNVTFDSIDINCLNLVNDPVLYLFEIGNTFSCPSIPSDGAVRTT